MGGQQSAAKALQRVICDLLDKCSLRMQLANSQVESPKRHSATETQLQTKEMPQVPATGRVVRQTIRHQVSRDAVISAVLNRSDRCSSL